MTLKLIYPALAQILWTFIVFGILFFRRKAAFESRAVRFSDVAVSTERYPDNARLAQANLANQFEMPVLFFALIMLAMEIGATSYVMAGLAWAFVATRVVHTLIHIGSNNIKHRASVFFLGLLVLFLMFVGVLLASI